MLNTEKIVVQGVIVSKISCNNERQKEAKRKNLDINQVPLRFGSMRLAVNLIEIEDVVYNLSKKPSLDFIVEDRLLLEISYRFDNTLLEEEVIKEHNIVNEMNVGEAVELTIEDAFISKKHVVKYINPEANKTIRSFFVKTWADNIVFLNSPELKPSSNVIVPEQVLTKVIYGAKEMLINI